MASNFGSYHTDSKTEQNFSEVIQGDHGKKDKQEDLLISIRRAIDKLMTQNILMRKHLCLTQENCSLKMANIIAYIIGMLDPSMKCECWNMKETDMYWGTSVLF